MAAQVAPQYRTNRSANQAKSFANGSVAAVTLLNNISGFPPFAPQKIELHNSSIIAGGTCTVTLEDGTDFVVNIGENETRTLTVPVKAFKSADATITANCYWWSVAALDDQQYQIARNP